MLLRVSLCIARRAISHAALEKLRNLYHLNFYERLTGLLFTAAKVRLWQSNAASAEWFRCSSVTTQLLTRSCREQREESPNLPCCRSVTKRCRPKGGKCVEKNQKEKRYILNAPFAPIWLEFKVALPENLWLPWSNKKVVKFMKREKRLMRYSPFFFFTAIYSLYNLLR